MKTEAEASEAAACEQCTAPDSAGTGQPRCLSEPCPRVTQNGLTRAWGVHLPQQVSQRDLAAQVGPLVVGAVGQALCCRLCTPQAPPPQEDSCS